jgi:hypothetical protein
MDAYNRGIGAQVSLSGDQIGDALLLGPPGSDSATGFAAQAYSWNGQTVISYRGTDQFIDILTGWITGAGVLGMSS